MTQSSDFTESSAWVTRLRRLGLNEVASALIGELRPLGLVGSQLITLTTPVLSTFVDAQRLAQLADWLEDTDRVEKFCRALESEEHS